MGAQLPSGYWWIEWNFTVRDATAGQIRADDLSARFRNALNNVRGVQCMSHPTTDVVDYPVVDSSVRTSVGIRTSNPMDVALLDAAFWRSVQASGQPLISPEGLTAAMPSQLSGQDDGPGWLPFRDYSILRRIVTASNAAQTSVSRAPAERSLPGTVTNSSDTRRVGVDQNSTVGNALREGLPMIRDRLGITTTHYVIGGVVLGTAVIVAIGYTVRSFK